VRLLRGAMCSVTSLKLRDHMWFSLVDASEALKRRPDPTDFGSSGLGEAPICPKSQAAASVPLFAVFLITSPKFVFDVSPISAALESSVGATRGR
jgi:hypothetical protein